MTAIRKENLQMIYSQHVTGLATDYDISNNRFGINSAAHFSPSYYLVYNFLLFGTTTTQIDTGSFYAFMSYEVSKQRSVIDFLQKILANR